ncbi:MAG: MFS transporter [Nakamurella sp.]
MTSTGTTDDAAPHREPRPPYVPDPRRWQILGVLSLALFMALIDVSIVNVALPSIREGLGATESDLQWVLSGYALTFGVILVAAGRAGDIFGRGPLFLAGVVVFTGSSAWAGFASDPLWLNIARALEGVGSGLISPQVVGMIQQYFRGAERGRAFGVFGAVVGISVAIGPVLGGVLIDIFGVHNGWRWVFFVNIPFGVLTVIMALMWFPRPLGKARPRIGRPSTERPSTERPSTERPSRAAAAKKRPTGERTRAPGLRDLDPVGSVLLGLAVLAVLIPFMESGTSPLVWIALPVGLGLVALWLAWERRYQRGGRTPMVDLRVFHYSSFSNGTLLMGLYFLGITSIWVLVAMYFQEGLGHSALASGLVGLPSAILSGLSALYAGRVVSKWGRKVVIAGIWTVLVGLVACMIVVFLHSHGVSEWWWLLTLAFLGIGQGAVISPNQALTLAEVPLEYAGSSGGVMQTIQRIGTSMGIAIITAITFAVLAYSNWAVAFNVGFAVIVVVVVLALIVGYVDLKARRGGPIL